MVPCEDHITHESSEECVCGPMPHFTEGGLIYVHPPLDARDFDPETLAAGG